MTGPRRSARRRPTRRRQVRTILIDEPHPGGVVACRRDSRNNRSWSPARTTAVHAPRGDQEDGPMSGIRTASTATAVDWSRARRAAPRSPRRRGVRRAEGHQATDRHHGEGRHGERERRRAARRGERPRRSLRRPDRTVGRSDRRADGRRRDPPAGARVEDERHSDGVHGGLPRRSAQRRRRRLGAGLPVPRVRRVGRRTRGLRAAAARCCGRPRVAQLADVDAVMRAVAIRPEHFDRARPQVEQWATGHPIEQAFAGRSSGASLLTSLRVRAGRLPRRGYGLGHPREPVRTAEHVRGCNCRSRPAGRPSFWRRR